MFEVDPVPVVDGRSVEWSAVVLRVAVAEDPGGVDEHAHRLRLAARLAAAARARRVRTQFLRLGERRLTLRLVVLDVREHERQLVVRHRHDPVGLAVDDRDRTPQ